MSTINANSLKQLGYTIEPVKSKSDQEKGWVFRLRGPQPVFHIKKTRSGKLLAFRSKEDKTETTINGLASFKEQDGDLIGSKYTAGQQKKQPKPAKTDQPVANAA